MSNSISATDAGDVNFAELAATIQNMEHDDLVEMLKNLDSDMVATDLEKMDPKSLAQLLALYKAGKADKTGTEIKGYAKAYAKAKPDLLNVALTNAKPDLLATALQEAYAKDSDNKAYAKDSTVAKAFAKDSKCYRSGI